MLLDYLNNIFLRRILNKNETSLPLSQNQLKTIEEYKHKINKYYKFEEISCLCGSTNDILIGRFDRYSIPLTTLLCKHCGIMRTSPRMSEESLVTFYEQDYRLIYGGSNKPDSSFINDQIRKGEFILDFLKHHFDFDKNSIIFDIGCGAGGTLLPFREIGCKTYGCDYGSNFLEYGRQNGLILEQGGYLKLEKYGKANIIILSHVLEHFRYPLKDLSKIRDLLTANQGLVYVELPGIFHIHRSYLELLHFFQNAHMFHFTLETLNYVMERSGYSLIKGDQFIHALYVKNETSTYCRNSNLYIKVIIYFYFLELVRISKFSNLARILYSMYKKLI